ncbi:hypothetical protein HCN44_004569 [Aphidius gifuensis]|uniref:HEAT repeat-containing protein 6 n=1 Tax=Aphidius gifuensis TaxID=684658 RepID=A0A834XZB7_APHGI|nr:HEAT repeat-containing protein 6 [Aphidius gifuensis]KAF7995097.1 hypothetical protein HCN44_004569 [Aphidius gifuensis]
MASYNMIDKSSKFISNTEQLLALTQHRINDKKTINKHLDELNNINYKNFIIPDNETVMLLINSLCNVIQVTETILINNYCKLICNLIEGGCTLSKRTYLTCKKWIFQVLEFSELSTKKNGLNSLKCLIDVGTFEGISQDIEKLVGDNGFIKTLAIPSNNGVDEINYLSVNCIESILISKEKNEASLSGHNRKIIKDIVINILTISKANDHNQLFYNKVICSCLRILSLLLSTNLINDDPESIGEVLGIIQSYLFHGIPNYQKITPQNLRPAMMNLPERVHVPPKGRSSRTSTKSKSKRLTTKKILDNSIVKQDVLKLNTNKSSDSETSDNETINQSRFDSKIRLETINLLYTSIREISSRQMFGYWSQIISSGTSESSRVLIKLILIDDYSKNRQNALSTLTEAINCAKTFLTHADDNEHPSFLTIFGTVGAMIKELHYSLSLLLSTEKNIAVITHALKCSSSLIQTTPYSRLKNGLAKKIARNCRAFIYHKDPTIRVAVLSVYESFANVDNITPEIQAILDQKYSKNWYINKAMNIEEKISSNNDDDVDDVDDNEEIDEIDVANFDDTLEIDDQDDDDSSKQMTILLDICLKNITDKLVHIPVRLQSLKLLAALSSNIDNSIINFLDKITNTLLDTFNENEPQIALHSCRVLEIISSKLSSTVDDNLLLLKKFWNEIFNPIIGLLKNDNTNLREVACDCLGSINNQIFNEFNLSQQRTVITILIGAVRDNETVVRAAGLRSLGLLITLPCLEDEIGFIMDLADLVSTSLDDKNISVRIKAAWTLANLTDCLIRQKNNDNIEQLNLNNLLPKLYCVSVNASKDNNKVKCNSLRAVGNIINMSNNRDILGDVSGAIDVLIDSAKSGNDMKVRWNSCRAIGFILSNEPDVVLPSTWRDIIFPELCELIIHASNFKVRTNAAWALTSCNCYGKYVVIILKNILIALDNSEHVPNFVEYGHRDALVQQLCLAFANIIKCIDAGHLDAIWQDLQNRIEYIAGYMRKFQERALPEKTRDLIDARLKMIELCQNKQLKDYEKNIANELAKIFDANCYL